MSKFSFSKLVGDIYIYTNNIHRYGRSISELARVELNIVVAVIATETTSTAFPGRTS